MVLVTIKGKAQSCRASRRGLCRGPSKRDNLNSWLDGERHLIAGIRRLPLEPLVKLLLLAFLGCLALRHCYHLLLQLSSVCSLPLGLKAPRHRLRFSKRLPSLSHRPGGQLNPPLVGKGRIWGWMLVVLRSLRMFVKSPVAIALWGSSWQMRG